jgi:hypothetical protein
MTRAWGISAGVLERRVDWVLQHLRHRQHGHYMTVRVSDFDAALTEWDAIIHELSHQIARAVFGFLQGVFEVREFFAFLVAGHATFIAEIDEIPGHSFSI